MATNAPQTDATSESVTILVNGTDVGLPDHKTSGAGITNAAIAAGVPIQPDFILYERRGNSSEYTKIEPDQDVTVHQGEQFRSVAPDDVA